MTRDELTRIYKKSNAELDGKAKPLTTDNIFRAMEAMAKHTAEQCAKVADKYHTPMGDSIADLIAHQIRQLYK